MADKIEVKVYVNGVLQNDCDDSGTRERTRERVTENVQQGIAEKIAELEQLERGTLIDLSPPGSDVAWYIAYKTC